MEKVDDSLKSVNHRFFWGQSFLQFLLIAWAWKWGGSSSMLTGFAVLSLVLVGVPHGGNDFFYRPDKSLKGSLRFLGLYLGSMALYLGIWQWAPAIALLLFLAISMHHFGQSNFNASKWYVPESLLWGAWLLGFPLVRHFSEATSLFSEMMGDSVDLSVVGWQMQNQQGLVLVAVFGLLYGGVLYLRRVPHAWQFFLQWILVTLWYWVSPLLLGFVVVFCLWHAAQSMRYQVLFIRGKVQKSVMGVLVNFLPLGFLAMLAWLVSAEFDVMHHLGWGFVLLSLVTLPHVVVMDGIYRADSHR
ncbi:MAG: hypothetical protein RL747_1228 [Bacteroidota bacterium]|jgi:Brp/Blh family beta-carotene 15,15'-monooxygenase|nr:Brp/Blh family beta-carotene 15,15'-dioxygenase [Bacteroidia bacterium]